MHCRELSLPKKPAHTTMRASDIVSFLLLSSFRSALPPRNLPAFPPASPISKYYYSLTHSLPTAAIFLEAFLSRERIANQTSSLFQNHLIRYLDRRCTKLERRKRYGLSIVPHIGSGRLHYPSQHLRQPSLPLSCTALLIVPRNATVGQNA